MLVRIADSPRLTLHSPRTHPDSPALIPHSPRTHPDSPALTLHSPRLTRTHPDSPQTHSDSFRLTPTLRLTPTHPNSPRLTPTHPNSPRTHPHSPQLTEQWWISHGLADQSPGGSRHRGFLPVARSNRARRLTPTHPAPRTHPDSPLAFCPCSSVDRASDS